MTPVVAIFHAKDGCEEILSRMFQSVIETTLKEDGCISYQLNRDVDDPRRFVWTEEWQSQEALSEHLASAHITEMFAGITDYIDHKEVVVLSKLAGGASKGAAAGNVCLTT